MRHLSILSIFVLLLAVIGCNDSEQKKETNNDESAITNNTKLLIDLPSDYNTPDGLAMSPDGILILSVPNFNNEHLMDSGLIDKPADPFMAKIEADNQISKWYKFKPADMHPETGKLGPMDAAFGPDGNLYVADMQVFYDADHKSRLVRINIENGIPTDMDVLVEGFNASNGLVWQDSSLFVTESVLLKREDSLISGVYAFNLEEFSTSEPIQLKPYSKENPDEHLVVHFSSDKKMGFGADGIVFDEEGYMYTTVIEKGVIYRSTLNEDNKAVKTELFAKDKKLVAPDGLIYNPERKKFYVADFLSNAVHSIDKDGNVTTLQKNGDVTGAKGGLDQPCEVIIRGDELIIVNMDMAWATRGLSVNEKVDGEYNLAVFKLPKK